MSKNVFEIMSDYGVEQKLIDAVRVIDAIKDDQLKHKILCNIMIGIPVGINCKERWFQGIDHSDLKGSGCTMMNMDASVLLRNSILGKIALNIELKVNNSSNTFENFYKDEKGRKTKECEHLEYYVDDNTRSFSISIFAVHDVPASKPVLFDEMKIKKIYMKTNLSDDTGIWMDRFNDYSVLDLILSLNKISIETYLKRLNGV